MGKAKFPIMDTETCRTVGIFSSGVNVVSALVVLLGVLFSYFTYTSKSWVEGINQLEPRMTKLETESKLQWEEHGRRLDKIDSNLERIWQAVKK